MDEKKSDEMFEKYMGELIRNEPEKAIALIALYRSEHNKLLNAILDLAKNIIDQSEDDTYKQKIHYAIAKKILAISKESLASFKKVEKILQGEKNGL